MPLVIVPRESQQRQLDELSNMWQPGAHETRPQEATKKVESGEMTEARAMSLYSLKSRHQLRARVRRASRRVEIVALKSLLAVKERRALTTDEELDIIDFIKEREIQGQALTRDEVRTFAQDIVDEKAADAARADDPFSPTAVSRPLGKQWLNRFLQRYKSQVKTQAIKGSRQWRVVAVS